MAKRGYTKIAEHFGWDEVDVKDAAYRPGMWSRPVYAFSDSYWSCGPTPPKDLYGDNDYKWEKVISAYDGVTILWKYTVSK